MRDSWVNEYTVFLYSVCITIGNVDVSLYNFFSRILCQRISPSHSFTAAVFYENLEQYILTEQQLKENGFPLSDPENPGLVKFYKTYETPAKGLKSK